LCWQLEKYNAKEPVNLGTGEEIPIRDLAKMIAAEVCFRGDLVWQVSKPNGQPRRGLDTSRARRLFGFRAAHRLHNGIPKTVAWFLAHSKEVREVTLDSVYLMFL
jgi:GDP-L-fucose synthase